MNIKFPEPPPGTLIHFEHNGYVRFAYRQPDTWEQWEITGDANRKDWSDMEEDYPDIANGDWIMVQTNAISGPG